MGDKRTHTHNKHTQSGPGEERGVVCSRDCGFLFTWRKGFDPEPQPACQSHKEPSLGSSAALCAQELSANSNGSLWEKGGHGLPIYSLLSLWSTASGQLFIFSSHRCLILLHFWLVPASYCGCVAERSDKLSALWGASCCCWSCCFCCCSCFCCCCCCWCCCNCCCCCWAAAVKVPCCCRGNAACRISWVDWFPCRSREALCEKYRLAG